MSPYTRVVSSFLFPLQERLKGHDTVRVRQAMERSQWWPVEQLRDLQMSRLRGLLQQVAAHVPFYRDLFRTRGLSAETFRTPGDLHRLPVIDKALIRDHGEAWQATGATAVMRQRTSGSSGEPLHYSLGRHRISVDVAARWRATRWWGLDVGDSELVLWGSPIEAAKQSRVRALRDRLFRSRLVSVERLDSVRLDVILDAMLWTPPRMLFGYPSAMARLAWRARERGLPTRELGIRVAFATSEVLRPEWRSVIADAFGCRVANEYGARDAGFIARECPQGGLHVTAEAIILEAVDEHGEPVPDGEEGELVVTNLAGPEFPFIRYRTGDRGVLERSQCPCGRGLPLLREVSGRTNDGLIALSGAWVHGSAFNYVMRELDGLRAYRIVQTSRERVDVLLAMDQPLPERGRDRILAVFQERLGSGVHVIIQNVDRLDPDANGKFRHVVCEVEDIP